MPTRKDFYSEDVQYIMGKAPSWVIRWGITIVFVIFMGIFGGCYFIKYPDIIISPVQITTYYPPVDLVSRCNGLIDTLFVEDGEFIERDSTIAVLENTAKWADIEFISEENYDKVIYETWINKKYSLGEVQGTFSDFQKKAKDYCHYLSTKQIPRKKELIKEQILKNQEYLEKLKEQYKCIKKDLVLQENTFKRDSLLYVENVISSADLESSLQNLIQKQNIQSGFNATLSSTELQIIQLEQQLIEINTQQENEISEYKRLLTQCFQQLNAELAKWKQTYTLIAPISGHVSFVSYWNENQHVKIGDKLASIIPITNNQIIGRIQVPSTGFGKVKVGQKTNIKLNGYPYMEFGVLKGEIKSLSAVPEQIKTANGNTIVYMAEIVFSDGLKTSYNKEIPMIQQMDGTAEIITEDMRLISRFYNPIVSLFRNR